MQFGSCITVPKGGSGKHYTALHPAVSVERYKHGTTLCNLVPRKGVRDEIDLDMEICNFNFGFEKKLEHAWMSIEEGGKKEERRQDGDSSENGRKGREGGRD